MSKDHVRAGEKKTKMGATASSTSSFSSSSGGGAGDETMMEDGLDSTNKVVIVEEDDEDDDDVSYNCPDYVTDENESATRDAPHAAGGRGTGGGRESGGLGAKSASHRSLSQLSVVAGGGDRSTEAAMDADVNIVDVEDSPEEGGGSIHRLVSDDAFASVAQERRGSPSTSAGGGDDSWGFFEDVHGHEMGGVGGPFPYHHHPSAVNIEGGGLRGGGGEGGNDGDDDDGQGGGGGGCK
jgi:hypothetical protein